jgi:hypothetical protein
VSGSTKTVGYATGMEPIDAGDHDQDCRAIKLRNAIRLRRQSRSAGAGVLPSAGGLA